MRKGEGKWECFNYPHKRIFSLDALSRSLSVPEPNLVAVAEKADDLYIKMQPKKKKDGSYRDVFDAKPQLKGIQNKIKSNILRKVKYPCYVQGGVPEKSCRTNAQIHVGAKFIINIDIKKFFPSTKKDLVFDVWKNFFYFSHDVSSYLAAITTKNGSLPEGASTSSYLANLVFFDLEPKLYAFFLQQKLLYSRFVDDITVSSQTEIDKAQIATIIKKVKEMLTVKGYKLNRSKLVVACDGQRMQVNNIVVNKKLSLPKKKKSQIRAAVKQLEMRKDRGSVQYKRLCNSVSGKVRYLLQYNKNIGNRLLNRLKMIAPTVPSTQNSPKSPENL